MPRQTLSAAAPSHRVAKPAAGLEIQGLHKRFGEITALEGVDLTIKRGEFLTLLGPSGCGKTTLLMTIAGFETPTRGEISLDGQVINALPAQKRNFGMVFQGYALFPHMTVRQNIIYPLEIRRQPKLQRNQRLEAMLKLVQLDGFADRYPRELSGGQNQRVALARALSFDPPILLLDEPLGALDKKLRMDVQIQLKEIHEKIGTTFIYVTHDQEEALSMSDRIAIMRQGKIVQLGTPHELYQHPATQFAADFLGKSNFLRGTVKSQTKTQVNYAIGGKNFVQTANSRAMRKGDKILLALRPEKIELAPKGKLSGKYDNKISGRVKNFSYFGANLSLTITADAVGEMAVEVDAWRGGHGFQHTQPVDLAWHKQAAVIVDDDE